MRSAILSGRASAADDCSKYSKASFASRLTRLSTSWPRQQTPRSAACPQASQFSCFARHLTQAHVCSHCLLSHVPLRLVPATR